MTDELVQRLREWSSPVEEAYADGGYAAGDGPEPPLDLVLEAADSIEEMEADIEGRKERLSALIAHEQAERASLSVALSRTEAERDAERAHTDRLAEALEEIHRQPAGTWRVEAAIGQSKAALAAHRALREER